MLGVKCERRYACRGERGSTKSQSRRAMRGRGRNLAKKGELSVLCALADSPGYRRGGGRGGPEMCGPHSHCLARCKPQPQKRGPLRGPSTERLASLRVCTPWQSNRTPQRPLRGPGGHVLTSRGLPCSLQTGIAAAKAAQGQGPGRGVTADARRGRNACSLMPTSVCLSVCLPLPPPPSPLQLLTPSPNHHVYHVSILIERRAIPQFGMTQNHRPCVDAVRHLSMNPTHAQAISRGGKRMLITCPRIWYSHESFPYRLGRGYSNEASPL